MEHRVLVGGRERAHLVAVVLGRLLRVEREREGVIAVVALDERRRNVECYSGVLFRFLVVLGSRRALFERVFVRDGYYRRLVYLVLDKLVGNDAVSVVVRLRFELADAVRPRDVFAVDARRRTEQDRIAFVEFLFGDAFQRRRRYRLRE